MLSAIGLLVHWLMWYRTRRRLTPPGGACSPDFTPSSQLFAVSPDAKLLFFGGNWDNSLRAYSVTRSKQLACVIRHQGFFVLFCCCSSSISLSVVCLSFSAGLPVLQPVVKNGKVNHAPQDSVGRCSSPSPWPWARRWWTTNVCDAWPVWRQTYGYLPSRKASPPVD